MAHELLSSVTFRPMFFPESLADEIELRTIGSYLRRKRIALCLQLSEDTSMVSIRLSRGGAKKSPFYHIVATDSRARRDGRYIERLGFYNPIARGAAAEVQLDLDRVDYWIGVGAQMSDRVQKVVKDQRKSAAAAAA